MRRCRICGVAKQLTDFVRHNGCPSGFENRCRACKSAQRRERRADPSELAHERELRRVWYYEKGGKKTVARNTRAFRVRTGYPGWSDAQHRRARNLVQAAVRRGQLIRQPCERCGKTEAQAHHDDYSKPLDVRWLCVECHHAHHFPAIRAQGKG